MDTNQQECYNALLYSKTEQERFNSLAFQLMNNQITRQEALASLQRAELASKAAWEKYLNPTPKKKTTKSKK
jgi:hypothetical protein